MAGKSARRPAPICMRMTIRWIRRTPPRSSWPAFRPSRSDSSGISATSSPSTTWSSSRFPEMTRPRWSSPFSQGTRACAVRSAHAGARCARCSSRRSSPTLRSSARRSWWRCLGVLATNSQCRTPWAAASGCRSSPQPGRARETRIPPHRCG